MQNQYAALPHYQLLQGGITTTKFGYMLSAPSTKIMDMELFYDHWGKFAY